MVELVRVVLAEFGLQFGTGASTDEQLFALPKSYQEHGGRFWVAERAGAVVGTCGLFPVDPSVFEVRKMYLLPAVRSLGVGRRLLDEAVAFARQQRARQLVLDTTEQMVRAIKFYEANGFVRDDAQKRGARCSRGYLRKLSAN